MNQFRRVGVTAAFVISSPIYIAACGWMSSSQSTASLSTESIPQSTQMQMLTAQVKGNTQGIRGLLISSNEHLKNMDLSNSFYAETGSERQLLGTVTSNSKVPHSFQAETTTGELIVCASLERKNTTALNSTQFKIQCNQNLLQVELSTETINTSSVDFHRIKKSLKHSAIVRLNSNNKHADIQITNDVLFVNRNGVIQQFKLKDFNEKISLAAKTVISLSGQEVCQNNSCSNEPETAELRVDLRQMTLKIYKLGNDNPDSYFTSTAETFSLSSYNVENFWDDIPDNSNPYNDYSSLYSNWYIGNFPRKKASRIKAALLAAGLPDIVGLQEIESANNKSRSLELLKPVLSELGYNYYALGLQAEDNPTAVTTAVISKFPISDNRRVDFVYSPDTLPDDQKSDFIGSSRDPQHVTIALPEGNSFVLINSHWKSKRDKSPFGDDMRHSVAKLIKQHSDSLKYENGTAVPVVIVGDFNADYREEPVQKGLQLANSIESARNEGIPKQLVPLWLTLAASEQGSYPHDSHLQALDNIVVTASFLQGEKLALSKPMWVVGRDGQSSHMLSNADGQPLRSQIVKYKDSQGDLHTRHFDLGYSDHYPLVAVFNRMGQATATYFPAEIEQQVSKNLSYNLIEGSECSSSETVSLTVEMLGTAQHGQCVSLSGTELPLERTGLYNIYIKAVGSGLIEKSSKIIITADRAYGANKQWLRGTLQNSQGRTLTKLKGRIGLVEGQKAVFIHSPTEDIDIK